MGYALENGKCYKRSSLRKGIDRASPDWNFRDCNVEGSCPSCFYSYTFCDVLCADPNCLACSTTETFCTECRRAATAADQTYLHNAKCILVNDIPLGYGIDTTKIRKASACADTTLCEDCRPNSAKCVKCKKDADGIEYPIYNEQCVLTTPGKGLDTQTGLLKSCLSGCLRCSRDYLICTQCDNTNLYYMGSDSDGVAQCQHASNSPTFPLSKGPDLTTMTVKSCPIGCIDCSLSNVVCRKCDTTNKWYLGRDCSGNPQCQHATSTPSIPLGFGPDAGDGTLKSCKDPNCKSCTGSFTVCTTCNAGYYLKNVLPADPTTCYDLASMPNYYGPVLTSNPLIVDACSTPSCLICSSDKSICNKCDGAYYLDSTNNKCVADSVASNTQGYGIVTTSSINEILPCKDLRCVTCSADHTKCTICNSATILNKVDSKCYATTDALPDGSGFVVSDPSPPSAIEKCTDPLCESCASNNMECTRCMSGNYWDSAALTCTADIAKGYGLKYPGSGLKEIVRCKSGLHCSECPDDFEQCTVCDSSSTFQDVVSKKCYTQADIPTGYGKDLSTAAADIRVCSQPDECLQCTEDYTKCTVCKDSYYFSSQDSKCYSLASIPSNTGVVRQPPGIKYLSVSMCDSAGCTDCSSDYLVCNSCDGSHFFDSTNKKCFSTVPKGFGRVTQSSTEILPCRDPDCLICDSIYTECSSCKSGVYLDVETSTCKSTIPLGKGKDTLSSSNEILTCSDSTLCSVCKDDYKVCLECIDPTNYYVASGKCTKRDVIPEGYGVDLKSNEFTVKPCADQNCDTCNSNYEVCSQCRTGSLLAQTTGKCYPTSQTIPEKLGKATTQEGVVVLMECRDSKCYDCSEDYTKCVQCDQGSGLDRIGNCLTKSTSPPSKQIVIPLFDRAPNTFGFSLSDKKITPNVLDYFIPSLITSSGKIIDEPSSFSLQPESGGFSVTIDTKEEFDEAKIHIDRTFSTSSSTKLRILAPALTPEEQATLDSIPFPFEGVVINNYHSTSTNAIRAFRVYTKIGIALRIASNILLPLDTSSRVAAFGVDRMFSHITLTAMQGSDKYVMSRMAAKKPRLYCSLAEPCYPSWSSTPWRATDSDLNANQQTPCSLLASIVTSLSTMVTMR